jgi:predicted GNAT family N-acyltransferase
VQIGDGQRAGAVAGGDSGVGDLTDAVVFRGDQRAAPALGVLPAEYGRALCVDGTAKTAIHRQRIPHLGNADIRQPPRLTRHFQIPVKGVFPVKSVLATSADHAPFYECTNPAISVARSAIDFWKMGRLRYELFIERDGKSYPEADRTERCFIEPIDLNSLNFLAIVGDQCVAACRVTRGDIALMDGYLARIVENSGMATRDLQTTAVCSRFSIATSLQARRLSVALLKEGYRAFLQGGMRTILLASRPSLAPFYGRFGFCETGKRYRERMAGELIVQSLCVHDRRSLQTCNSVLLEVHDQLMAAPSLETTL